MFTTLPGTGGGSRAPRWQEVTLQAYILDLDKRKVRQIKGIASWGRRCKSQGNERLLL